MSGKSVRKEDTTNLVEVFPAAGDRTAEGFKERREGVLPHIRVNDSFISQKKKNYMLIASTAFAFSVLTMTRLHASKTSRFRVNLQKVLWANSADNPAEIVDNVKTNIKQYKLTLQTQIQCFE